MTKVTILLTTLAGFSLVACKNTSDAPKGGSATAAKPAEAPPAARAPKQLAKVGVTVALPADALIAEDKMDMGGFMATISFNGMANFFISNVADGADSLDRTIQHADAKAWKIQDKAADGSTWRLEWTHPQLVDPNTDDFGVAVRAKVGSQSYDCGANALSAGQAAQVLEICASMK